MGKPSNAMVSWRWMREMTRLLRFFSISRIKRKRAASNMRIWIAGHKALTMKKSQKKSVMDIWPPTKDGTDLGNNAAGGGERRATPGLRRIQSRQYAPTRPRRRPGKYLLPGQMR